jgi:hypothetical protein
MALGSTQPLTEMSTKNLPGGKGRPAREADHLTAICEMEASTPHNPMALHRLLQRQFYLSPYLYHQVECFNANFVTNFQFASNIHGYCTLIRNGRQTVNQGDSFMSFNKMGHPLFVFKEGARTML